jgi:hypothetical protein
VTKHAYLEILFHINIIQLDFNLNKSTIKFIISIHGSGVYNLNISPLLVLIKLEKIYANSSLCIHMF